MINPSILLDDGSEYGGIMDAFITSLCSMHDLKSENSTIGSIMIVKPKQHGPDECEFTDLILEKWKSPQFAKIYY